MYESICLQDDQKIFEAALQLINFLIKYKLKPSDYNKDLLPNEIEDRKIDVLKFILEIFSGLDKITERFNLIDKSEFLKNFLERKNKFEIIQIPYPILLQNSNYLKGKLAMYTGNYANAFIFFNKSKEKFVISDANIIQSSIKNLYKIISHFYSKLEQDLNYPNFKQFTLKKTKQYYESVIIKSNKQLLTNYLKELELELQNYSYIPKDLIVMIDYSATMIAPETKKIDLSSKKALYLFDNFITEIDRFGLFIFKKYINSIVSLVEKNKNNIFYLREIISSLEKNMRHYENDGESDLCTALDKITKYLRRKGKNERQNWIIILTDKLFYNHDQVQKIKEKIKDLEDENINTILMEVSMNNRDKEYCKRIFKSSKTSIKIDFIENFDDSKLMSLLRINGVITEDGKNFMNERYIM